MANSNNRETLINDIKNGNVVFNTLSKEEKEDKEIILTFLKHIRMYVSDMRLLSKELLADKDIAIAMVSQEGSLLKFINDDFKIDEDVVYAAVKDSASSIVYADPIFLSNKDKVMKLIEANYTILLSVTADLKKDRDIAIKSVTEDGLALGLLPHFNDDKEIVELAIKGNGMAIKFASEKWQNNKELVLKTFKKNANSFIYLNKRMKEDRDVIKKALSVDGLLIDKLEKNCREDKELGLIAVRQNGGALQYLSFALRADAEVVEEALVKEAKALYYCSSDLRLNEKFLCGAIKKNILVLEKVKGEIKDSILSSREFIDEIKNAIIEKKEQMPEEYNIVKKFIREDELKEEFLKIDRNETDNRQKRKI